MTVPPGPSPVPQSVQTVLRSFVSLARRAGVELRGERLVEEYGLQEEVSTADLHRIAADHGLVLTVHAVKWSKLKRLGDRLPCLVPLKNGNMVVLGGIKKEDGVECAAVWDPLTPKSGFLKVPREQFEKSWEGTLLSMTATSPFSDDGQSFGLWWFTREIRRYRAAFASVMLCGLFTNLAAFITPLFMMLVLDKVVIHHGTTTLTTLGIAAVAMLLFDAGFDFFKSYFVAHSVRGIDSNLMVKVFSHLLKLPIDYLERVPRGVLARHIQQTERIRQFLTGRLFILGVDLLFVLLFLVALFLFSWQVALMVTGGGILLLAIGVATAPTVRAKVRQSFAADGQREALLIETIAGIDTVKSLALESRQRRRWENITARTVATRYEQNRLTAGTKTLTSFIEKMIGILLIWLGAYLVMEGHLTTGAFVAMNLLARRVTGPLVQFANVIQDYQEILVAVRMLGEIMNRQPEQEEQLEKLLPAVRGQFEIEGLSFSYPGTPAPALRNVSVKIPAGAMIGVVGRSGSGKSTLIRLMLGLYPLQTGIIRLDGYDIREIDYAHLRRRVGTVLQDNVLFTGTVRDNIAAGDEGASLEDVIRAAKLAGADEFIQRMPKGYETQVDENGTNMSGGQRQRIALARALLREPAVLILDEATSALDPESEAIIRNNLGVMRRGRTVIMVSHRLSMLSDADAIVVLDRGAVVDIGRHRDLVGRCDVYRTLWNEQARSYA